MPLGTMRAMWQAATVRTVWMKVFQLFLPSCRQLYGHPMMTVLGFMPPSPMVWMLC